MTPRDWILLSARLFAIYLGILTITPVADLIRWPTGLRGWIGGVLLVVAYPLVGLALWRNAPRLAAVLAPAAGEDAPTHTITTRDAVTAGLMVVGMFLAATSTPAIVANLQYLFPERSGLIGSGLVDPARKQALYFFVGQSLEAAAGLMLFFGARSFAARATSSESS